MGSSSNAKALAWKTVAIVFIIFDIILTVFLFVVLSRHKSQFAIFTSNDNALKDRQNASHVFQRTLYPSGSLSDYSPFAPLSPDENVRVRNFVQKQQGLKPYALASVKDLSDPYIYLIELVMPDKAEAVAYLAGDRKSRPVRTARVVIYNGGLSRVEEYSVGPVERPTWIRKLQVCGNRTDVPWTFRPNNEKEYYLIGALTTKEMAKGNEIWEKSFHSKVCDHLFVQGNNGGKCLMMIDVAPKGYKSGQRISWAFFLRTFKGFYSHPVPLLLQFQHEGVDPKSWKILQVLYGDRSFPSVDALVSEYKAGTLKLIEVPKYPNSDSIFSDMTYDSQAKSKASTRGPTMNSGRRYKFFGNQLTYLDWSLHIGMRTGLGLALFDIRFAGERIAYELSNQEAAVMYSGRTPISGFAQYFDSSWTGMGLWSHELVPGIDCPAGATFLDTSFFVDGNYPKVNRRAVCVFEWNTGTPLGRHLETDLHGSYFRYAGVPGHALVIRQIATVFNYDYIFDILFHLDGSIEVRIAATGYLQTGYTLPKEAFPEVAPKVIGQLHQHFYNWKVDLDVKGSNNAFSDIAFVTEKVPHPAFPKMMNRSIIVPKFNLKKTEMEANVKYNFRKPKYYLLHASESDNRGYRIIVDHMAMQPLPENELAEYAMSFTRYPISITRRKEIVEDTSVNLYSQNGPFSPDATCSLQNFYKDNEDIVNKDLVVWVSQGHIHLPHNEDIPITTTPTATTRFLLQPYNFFKSSPMTRSKDTVVLEPRQQGGSDVTYYVGHESLKDYRLMSNFNGSYYYP